MNCILVDKMKKTMKYYVLWKKNNEMLSKYRDKYFELLQGKIRFILNSEIKFKLEWLKNNKEFILYCDNSSRIEYLYLIWNWEEKLKNHLEIEYNFIDDINYFIDYNSIYINSSKLINWTDIYLSKFDRNPYNTLEEHPDREWDEGQIWFGNKSEEYWLNIYSQVFQHLKKIDSGIYDELNFIIQKIIPLWTSTNVHNSASYQEAIGHLYMWLTTNSNLSELTIVIHCLEWIIHESSHNKLNLINKFDRVLLNDYTLWFYSPYRPDARHVRWVFLWIHAFVPTIYTLVKYYIENNLSDEHLLEKIIEYNIKNNLSYKILKKYWKFTKIWDEIMSEILTVMKLTNIKLKELNINNEISQRSKEKVSRHFWEVKKLCPTLKY